MAAGPTSIDGTVRSLRVLHGVFMFTMVMYGYVLRVIPQTTQMPDARVLYAITGIAILAYFASVTVHIRLVGAAVERLRIDANDLDARGKWRKWLIFGDVTMETVVLFGFALYFVGVPVLRVVPFFVIPFVTMLFLFPRRP